MKSALLVLSLGATTLHAAEPCRWIHGRAHFYYGDGQFRIWHIGTHHEFSLASEWDSSVDESPHMEEKMLDLLREGIKDPVEVSDRDLFADFLVCPAEPYRQGAAQSATVKRMRRVHLVAAHP